MDRHLFASLGEDFTEYVPRTRYRSGVTEEQKKNIASGFKKTGKFIQDLAPTTPQEIAQETVELTGDLWSKGPYRGGAMYLGKKLIQNSPEAAKAWKIAKETASPYIQRGKEWLEKDRLEPAYAAIENLTGIKRRVEPVNPNVMKFDSPNNKRLLDIEEANRTAAQNARDTYTSTKATVTSDPTDIQVYDLHAAKKAIKADIPKELGGKLNTLTRIPEAPSKQFHHIFLKDLASEYVQAARRMGTPDEVIQLDRIAKKYGFGLGNYKSAGDYLDTVPHSLGHKEALLSKVQPSGEALKLKKSGIKDIGNIKELNEDFEKTIKEVVMPMKEVMDEFQDIWDTIPPKERLKLIKLRLNRAALRKRFKTKAEGQHWELDSATNAYRKQKDKLKRETFKIKDWKKQHRENVSELKFDQQLKDAYDEFSKN